MYLTFIVKDYNNIPTNTDYTLDDVFAGREFTPVVQTFTQKYRTKTVITHKIPTNFDANHHRNTLLKLQTLTVGFDKNTLDAQYNTFYIPKNSGGLREINAPKDDLMEALRLMKDIFQYDLKTTYHDAAYAYVPTRNIKSALEVHQTQKSKWFLKLDIKNFFPSCNKEFVIKSLHKIYPFSQWSEEELESFLWLCFRHNELPQGTPMSPMLTNLIMIPIDYAIREYCWRNKLVYTRYADDILISGKKNWDWRKTIQAVNKIFETLQTPFQIKTEKTRYGSSAGRNWNLGLMLNKDNNITVGYKKKKIYKAMLNNLMIAESSGQYWNTEEIYHFQGITSYYLSIEPDYFKQLIRKYENNYNLTLKEIYKRAL